jgi:hypothetical protein
MTIDRFDVSECQLSMYRLSGRLSHSDLPSSPNDCQVFFPTVSPQRSGLLVTLERLNVPCNDGFVRLYPGNPPSPRHGGSQQNLCGKLEELPDSDRHFYFSGSRKKTNPFVHAHASPLFVIAYRLVDYCYNVTLTARNGSFEIEPTSSLHCTFRIHLPFGNRVALRLQMGEKSIKPIKSQVSSTTTAESLINEMQEVETKVEAHDGREPECQGLSIKLWDGANSWLHCSKPGDPLRNVQIISKQNSVIMFLVIHRTSNDVVNSGDTGMFLKVWYHAEPMAEIVGQCAYGWVSIGQFCMSVFERSKLPWMQAEHECVKLGGHLASIRSEQDQALIDRLLTLRYV